MSGGESELGMDLSARITLTEVHTTLMQVKSLVETSLAEQRTQIGNLIERQSSLEARTHDHDGRLRAVELAQASAGAVQQITVAADTARTNRVPAWVSITVAVVGLGLSLVVGVASLLRS